MIARIRTTVSTQLSRPHGRAGRLVAALMNRGNRALNARAIDLLDVIPGARVLDLGFGGGVTFPILLARGATVVGVDRAGEMVAAARRRHTAEIRAGRLTVHGGDVGRLPLGDASVERILTVNTVYFWPDLPSAFAELRRVLAADGRVVIGIRDGSVMGHVSRDVFTLRSPSAIAEALGRAGFASVEVHSAADGRTHLISAAARGGAAGPARA